MLTYQDRIDRMRKKKIDDTLKKREQNGYTDLDDFGTVPLPEGYKVTPWYNSENGSFYGYDGMCENFCRVIDAHPAYVDPMEMLCGRWRLALSGLWYTAFPSWDSSDSSSPFSLLMAAQALCSVTN